MLFLSKHAKEKARERGISINEIKRTIQMGAKFLQDDKFVSDFMHVRVIYKKIRDTTYVITIMIRR